MQDVIGSANALACTLLALAQLAIMGAGFAVMFGLRPAAGKLFLVGLGFAVAASATPRVFAALEGFLNAWAIPLLVVAAALLSVRFIPFRKIARGLWGTPARTRLPRAPSGSSPASRSFPGYRNR